MNQKIILKFASYCPYVKWNLQHLWWICRNQRKNSNILQPKKTLFFSLKKLFFSSFGESSMKIENKIFSQQTSFFFPYFLHHYKRKQEKMSLELFYFPTIYQSAPKDEYERLYCKECESGQVGTGPIGRMVYAEDGRN